VITDLLGKTVLVILSLAIITTLETGQISRADPLHCDRTGYPSCYSLGFSDDDYIPLSIHCNLQENTNSPHIMKCPKTSLSGQSF
jgi:hypothetical protein